MFNKTHFFTKFFQTQLFNIKCYKLSKIKLIVMHSIRYFYFIK